MKDITYSYIGAKIPAYINPVLDYGGVYRSEHKNL